MTGENSMDLTGIDYLGIDRVLKRGTGKVIERHDTAVLVHDRINGAYMLGCEDAALGADILRRRLSGDCRLLMVSDHSLGIDKRTYHKISTDFGYKPSRMTAMRCCIGLQLNAEEAEELLKLAGMAFSPNDPNDLVLKFCLEKGIRDIPGINYMLYRYANREAGER